MNDDDPPSGDVVRVIDLNADVGEGAIPVATGGDAALLRSVTTAHVACGFHAGDLATMRDTVLAARATDTVVGAHPSYPDRAGFGRVALDRPASAIAVDLQTQLSTLQAIASSLDTPVLSVKAHGALYHRIATDPSVAVVFADVITDLMPDACVVLPTGALTSELMRARKLKVVAEGFCDRRYLADGTLKPRSLGDAVLSDVGEITAQAVLLATRGLALTEKGDAVSVPCDTICIHGDGPRAPSVGNAVRLALEEAGVLLAPVQGPSATAR